MTSVYFFEIPVDTDYEKYLNNNLLTEEMLITTENLPMLKRISSLLAEIIVKTEVAGILKVNPKELLIVRTQKGKPYFKYYPHIHFNISHSKGGIAVAISDSEIGIDIETLSKHNPKIAERYFTEAEKSYIKNHPSPDNAFYEIWTAKEAFFKYKGSGIEADFFKTSVLDENIKEQIYSFNNNGFIISLCTNNPQDFKFKSLTADYFENI